MRMRARQNTDDQGDVFMTSIVTAIAEAKHMTPAELQTPLYEVIDTDALVEFLKDGDETTSVTFQYNRLTVKVSGNCEVTVTEPLIEP